MLRPSLLVVEDDHLQANEIAHTLTNCDYQVVGHADNGLLAIEMARKSNPDAIIMDIELKGEMTGIQAARLIYEELAIPIIYLTLDDTEGRYLEARKGLKAEYIPKPYKRVHLLNALDNIFSRYWEYAPTRHSKLFSRLKEGVSNTFICIDVVSICFVQGHGKACTVFLDEGQYTISSSLHQVESKLLKLDQFVKANRSHLVNVEKIHSLEGKTAAKSIKLASRTEVIPVSAKYQNQVMSRLYRI